MENTVKKLNHEFNVSVLKAKNIIQSVGWSEFDKSLVKKWLKLLAYRAKPEEAQLRNDFMYCLMQDLRNGKLTAPFDADPPINFSETLLEIRDLLPKKTTYEEAPRSQFHSVGGAGHSFRRSEIFEKSPDGGAFLAQQPIPKSGVFCYLAVTSRSPCD